MAAEAARSARFAALLGELFGARPRLLRDYLAGRERPVQIHEGAQIHTGRIDSLCGNLVIEFKATLAGCGRPGGAARGNLADAQAQLRQYISALWSEERPGERRPYLAMATDGELFAVYTPLIADPSAKTVEPDDVQLRPLTRELINLRDLPADRAVSWLDRYFLHKEPRRPTTDEIVADFGLDSHAFRSTAAELAAMWSDVSSEDNFAVLFQSWDNYLRVAYGTSFADQRAGVELFIRHSYLATLAKLMVYSRISGRLGPDIPDDRLREVLDGSHFQGIGISNFLEEDFFAWIVRGKLTSAALAIARRLADLLDDYDLTALTEDVFKGLYEQLVDPEGRHDLGEYYTPDWLAERLVRRVIDDLAPDARVIDPACGSGTFLYWTIRYKLERLSGLAPPELLQAIQEQVVGIDVHPLAVIIAKANYVLALGDLLASRHGPITIPVYLANSILPAPRGRASARDATSLARYPGLRVYGVPLGRDPEVTVHIPAPVASRSALCDRAIDACRTYAVSAAGRELSRAAFKNFILRRVPEISDLPAADQIVGALFDLASTFADFIARRRDTIQAYVLKNTLRPLFLRHSFHAAIGNPPWLSYRYIRAPEYQAQVRELMQHYGLWPGAHNATHTELATLFFVRCADWYLGERGKIGFVLPRSIFAADQHARFRAGELKQVELRYEEVWDLEGVEPLFNVPASVLVAEKAPGASVGFPLPCLTFAGELPRRNADSQEASSLEVAEAPLYHHTAGRRSYWSLKRPLAGRGPSPYKERFREGASVVPRALWFVEVVRDPRLGYDQQTPLVRTDPEILRRAKKPWRQVRIEGPIEREFLYPVILGVDLVPFGVIAPHLAVIPILPDGEHYRLLDAEAAEAGGYLHLARWLRTAEEHWARVRGAKAQAATLYEWIDYRHKLSAQGRAARIAATMSGSILAGAPVDAGPVIVDYTLYWAAASEQEQAYLSAVLCAPATTAAVAPMQTRGAFGRRHFCAKVWELPIPEFDPDDPIHQRLAELGRQCAGKVDRWLREQTYADSEEKRAAKVDKLRSSIGHTRRRIRAMLSVELEQIDRHVRELLGVD